MGIQKILALLLLLVISLAGAVIGSWGAYECFKIRDKFVGCLFGFNGLLCIVLFIVSIIRATM